MESHSDQFTFTFIPQEKFDPLNRPEISKLLEKWGLKGRMALQAFALDEPFHPYQKQTLLDSFFTNPVVLGNLKTVDDKDEWRPLGVQPHQVVGEFVPCSTTSMDLFNRLESSDIVRPGGHINGCLEEFIDGMQISDELRKFMLSTIDERVESDTSGLFTDAEMDEFIFHLFRHFCLGGSLCQYEDNIEAYLEVTKQIYKDVLSVAKDPAENRLVVTSSVFKVRLHDVDGTVFFPSLEDNEHPQTFFYLIVSPQKKRVFTFYHSFVKSLIW